jgi:hypothetical protein
MKDHQQYYNINFLLKSVEGFTFLTSEKLVTVPSVGDYCLINGTNGIFIVRAIIHAQAAIYLIVEVSENEYSAIIDIVPKLQKKPETSTPDI